MEEHGARAIDGLRRITKLSEEHAGPTDKLSRKTSVELSIDECRLALLPRNGVSDLCKHSKPNKVSGLFPISAFQVAVFLIMLLTTRDRA